MEDGTGEPLGGGVGGRGSVEVEEICAAGSVNVVVVVVVLGTKKGVVEPVRCGLEGVVRIGARFGGEVRGGR